MIIVTTGHVDHGKTALLQALTGINADRLPEEKQRGMTIDLGYAFMDINHEQRLAFIDVPGHEKFINNMLSGISHAKHALLVVAGDDGVMPQTREHLQILSLLELSSLTVVLTKCDKVDSNRIEIVLQQIDNLLAESSSFASVAIDQFAVSSISGVGIESLKQHLCQLANHELSNKTVDGRSFRMNIDRAFSVKGAGLVVTGTVLSGSVNIGDSLFSSNQTAQLKVRSIHAQGQAAQQGKTYERVALNLTGANHHQLPARGDWLTHLVQVAPTQRVTVHFKGKVQPSHWQSVHLHHGASHSTGRIGYLASTKDGGHLLELILDTPWLVANRDLIVIRDASGKRTLGGARVIELTPVLRGKRKPQRLTFLQQLAECKLASQALDYLLKQSLVKYHEFCWAWQLLPQTLDALINDAFAYDICTLNVKGYLLGNTQFQQLAQKLLTMLTEYHSTHPDELGLAHSRIARMLQLNLPEALFLAVIAKLIEQQKLTQTRGLYHLPRHELCLDYQEQQLWLKIQVLLEQQQQPLWLTDFAKALDIDISLLRHLCFKLVQLGYLFSVVKDRYLTTEQVQGLAQLIRQHLNCHDSLETAEFRQMVKLGRKVSIQLLEMFDKVGFTQRKYQSNERQLKDNSMFVGLEHIGGRTQELNLPRTAGSPTRI